MMDISVFWAGLAGLSLLLTVYFYRERDRLMRENQGLLAQVTSSEVLLREGKISRDALLSQFEALSAEVLRSNSESFFRHAEETLKGYQALAKQDLDAKGEAIKEVLTPLKESIVHYQERLSRLENERALSEGKLSEQLSMLFSTSQSLQKETANLVNALKKPEVRGTWGEVQLRRVVELAGMSEYCDFTVQDSVSTEAGRYRPDLVVRLPNQRSIIVDSKAVMNAFLDAVESKSEEARKACIERHARQVKDQVNLLASKRYADQYSESPEFVVCFLPGEAFLYAACEGSLDLIEYAMNKNVILATPTTLIALLKVVAFGWRQEEIARNARLIGEQATELIERLGVALRHLGDHGEQLARSVSSYNKFIGSIDRNVTPQAERILELGVKPVKELPTLTLIEAAPRTLREGGSYNGTDGSRS